MRRTIILVAIICTSAIVICQRSEDIHLILSGTVLEACAIHADANHCEHLKNESFLFEIVKLPIVFWQGFISSQMKPRCYFYPSCSQFSFEAIRQYGLLGVFLGLDRISRCNVFSEEKYPYYENTQRLHDPVDHYGVNSRHSRQNRCSHD